MEQERERKKKKNNNNRFAALCPKEIGRIADVDSKRSERECARMNAENTAVINEISHLLFFGKNTTLGFWPISSRLISGGL